MRNGKNRRLYLSASIMFGLLVLQGCGGALFKVKPVVELSPLPAGAKSGTVGGITLRVAPLLTDEESQQLFEANLPVAGLLPVRIEMHYDSGAPLEIKKAKFRLRDSQGREWKLVSAKQATSRIMKSNGIYAYNPNSKKQFEKEFGAYEIDLKTPLTAGERRQGFMFFQTPDKTAVTNSPGLVLIAERLPEALEIRLN